MNAKTLLSLVVALALGLAATWVGRNIILGHRTLSGDAPQAVSVVVARADLEPGRLIEPEDLSTVDIPSSSLTKTMFTDTKAVAGRAVLSPVIKGQTMFEGLLAAPGSEGGLQVLVPEGKRAVSVEVNESSAVAGLLTPGCRVDVIATLRTEEGGSQTSQMARTIVENVKVQAVNRRLSREKNEDPGTVAVRTVTLIVNPKDAEAIELASNSGKLRLVLRGQTDTAPTQSIGVTYAELTGKIQSVPYVPPMQPRTASNDQKGSGLERFLATMLNQPGTREEAVAAGDEQEQAMRQAVRVIRGNTESTIFYELQPAKPGQATDDWSVSSGGGTPSNEKADPFGLHR